jgi:hypothetical protein
LRVQRRPENRDPEGTGITPDPLLASHKSHLGAELSGVLLQNAQIEWLQRDLFSRGPDQQNARRLGPRHAIAYRDQIVMGCQRYDLRLHSA